MKNLTLLAACSLICAVPACSQPKPAAKKIGAAAAKPAQKPAPMYVQNGEFSAVQGNRFANWNTSGDVQPEATSGAWKRLTAKFKTGNETRVFFTFWIPRGASGSVWMDNLIVDPPLAIDNAGLESGIQNGQLPGWLSEDLGRTVFMEKTRASEGKQSVRVTHAHEAIPATMLWHELTVEPNKEYTLSFDIYVGDDFQGEAKGWLFNAARSTSLDFEIENLIGSKLVEDRDRMGKFAAALRPTAGQPATLTQEINVTPGSNLAASFDLENKAFKGDVTLVARDGVSNKVLQQVAVSISQDKAQTPSFSFQSLSGKVKLQLQATGEGYVRLDNLAVTPPRIEPTVQQANWLPAAENYKIPSQLSLFVEGKSGEALDGAIGLLNKDLKPYNVVARKGGSAGAKLRIFIGDKYKVEKRGPESYTLAVDRKGVVIKAASEAGAFYGIMSLLQLIESRDGKPVFLPCKITDNPDMEIRGFLYADAEQAARMKMNTLMVSTGFPVAPADRQGLRDSVAESRSLNLDYIPMFMTLMGGYYVQGINPNLAAGIWVQDEKVSLKGTEPAQLANPYVIRTALSDIVLKSASGTVYKEGVDYRVIDGEMKYNYDNPNARRFAVARLPGSSIPDGATVLASYDWVSHTRGRTDPHIPYVPLEPEAKKLHTEFLTDLARDFDFRYINSFTDFHEYFIPANMLKTDSRVIKSGKKTIDLLVEEAHLQADAIKQGNPKTRPFQWTGDVSEEVRYAAKLMPKDSLINIWGYDASWPTDMGREAVSFWNKFGFETTVMPWDNLTNIRAWAQVVAEAQRKGYKCRGMIGSGWEGRPTGFHETAMVAWRIPRKGEKNYVALPAEPKTVSK